MNFVKASGLDRNEVLVLFGIRVIAGVAVWLVSHYLFNDLTDYYTTNQYGIQEYHSLIDTPLTFFTDLFSSSYTEKSEFFGSHVSYWNDLRYNLIYKVLAFTNIFSRGNYYINSLFFNFAGFIGTIAFYRIFINIYRGKKWPIVFGCFLLPSLLFYSSGIHKDLIVFTGLGIFCYCLYTSLEKGFALKRIVGLILSFIIILLIRNFIAVILLPCAFAWFVSKKYTLNPLKVFGVMFAFGMVATIFLHTYFKKADPLMIVVNRQQAFYELGKAETAYYPDTLHATAKSFITLAPTALRHSFLSPLPGEFDNIYTNLISIEVILHGLLFMLMIFFPVKNILQLNEFVVFGLLFTFVIFLFTGYITTNAGALIRYRSIYLPLLMVPVLCSIQWNKLSGLFSKS